MAYFNNYTGKDKNGLTRKEFLERNPGLVDANGQIKLGGHSYAKPYQEYVNAVARRTTAGTPENTRYLNERRELFDHMRRNGSYSIKKSVGADGKTETSLYWKGRRGSGQESSMQLLGTAAGNMDTADQFFKNGDLIAGLRLDNVAKNFDRGFEYVMGRSSSTKPGDPAIQANEFVSKLQEAHRDQDKPVSRGPGLAGNPWYEAMANSVSDHEVKKPDGWGLSKDVNDRKFGDGDYMKGIPTGHLDDLQDHFAKRGITYSQWPEDTEGKPSDLLDQQKDHFAKRGITYNTTWSNTGTKYPVGSPYSKPQPTSGSQPTTSEKADFLGTANATIKEANEFLGKKFEYKPNEERKAKIRAELEEKWRRQKEERGKTGG